MAKQQLAFFQLITHFRLASYVFLCKVCWLRWLPFIFHLILCSWQLSAFLIPKVCQKSCKNFRSLGSAVNKFKADTSCEGIHTSSFAQVFFQIQSTYTCWRLCKKFQPSTSYSSKLDAKTLNLLFIEIFLLRNALSWRILLNILELIQKL